MAPVEGVLVGAGVHALGDGEPEGAWSEVVVEVEDTYTVKAERR